MTSGAVHFASSPHFTLYDLQFQPKNPSQLDVPTLNEKGNWQFDSSFDITYKAVISAGLQPAHTVSGFGTVRAVGMAPSNSFTQVFDSELVSLNLFGLSPIPEVMFRESPTLRSAGITTREDTCPQCDSIFTHWQISSYFDAFAEFSFNGGNTWTPGDQAIHIEQIADPAKAADYNGNGIVDAGDYVTWRRGYGTTYDYDLWRAHFGATPTTGSGTAEPESIPEPSASWLLAVAAIRIVLMSRSPLR
jgi:hypothetical protein